MHEHSQDLPCSHQQAAAGSDYMINSNDSSHCKQHHLDRHKHTHSSQDGSSPGHSSQDGNAMRHSRSAAHDGRGEVRYAGSEREGCCGLSLDELSHEGLGQKQELRSQDDQNKFVAAMVRKGLYCDGWKLVITGVHTCVVSCCNRSCQDSLQLPVKQWSVCLVMLPQIPYYSPNTMWHQERPS